MDVKLNVIKDTGIDTDMDMDMDMDTRTDTDIDADMDTDTNVALHCRWSDMVVRFWECWLTEATVCPLCIFKRWSDIAASNVKF